MKFPLYPQLPHRPRSLSRDAQHASTANREFNSRLPANSRNRLWPVVQHLRSLEWARSLYVVVRHNRTIVFSTAHQRSLFNRSRPRDRRKVCRWVTEDLAAQKGQGEQSCQLVLRMIVPCMFPANVDVTSKHCESKSQRRNNAPR